MEGFPSAVVMAEYIDAMLELIPAKFYFQQEGDPDQWRSKFSKNTKKSKQMAAYKQDKRAEAREHKKEKFDTAEKQSLKRKLHAQQEAKNKKNGGKGGQAKRGRSSSERDSDNADSDGDDSAPGLAPTQRADSLDALRERLTMKIQLMRTGRSGQGRPRPRNFESRRGAKSAGKRSGENGDGDDEETSSKSAKRASQQAQTKEQAKIASSLGTDVDQIDFNSFTFDAAASRQNAGVDDTVRGTGSASGERLGSRKRPNLRKLVQKADEKAKRIRALKESGEAPEEVAREAWDSALLKAKGGKPLDDVKCVLWGVVVFTTGRIGSRSRFPTRSHAVTLWRVFTSVYVVLLSTSLEPGI